jgi:hypothetical protein
LKQDGKDAQNPFKILQQEKFAEAGVIFVSGAGSRPSPASICLQILMKHPPRCKKKTKQDERNRGKDVYKVKDKGTLCIRTE